MKDKIRVGIIGTGMFGRHHIESFQRSGRAKVVHLANRGSLSRNAAQADYGIARASADALDLIGDPEIDAVVVATPPDSHAEFGIAALEAGKHLLLEKPMAANLGDAQRLVDCAAAHPGQVALEASCRHTRLHAKFRFIKDFIDSGRIGRVYHIHQQSVSRNGFYEYNPNGAGWCFDKSKAGGGPMIDMGEYDLGFHLGLLGDRPELLDLQAMAVSGLRHYPGHKVSIEQHAAAWLRFSGDLTYYLERGGPVAMDAPEETRIYGSAGGLRFTWQTWLPWSMEWCHDGPDGQPVSQSIAIPQPLGQNDDDEVAGHFLDCVANGAAPAMHFALALRHFQISLAIVSGTRMV